MIHQQRLARYRELLAELEYHVPGEAAHAERVASYAVATGEKLGLEDEDLNDLRLAAGLHDLGKLDVPAHIITKSGWLEGAEVIELRRHVAAGAKRLSEEPLLWHLADTVCEHHERWDGAGYPFGHGGPSIPLLARIVAVAEAYDAMTRDKRYRNPLNDEQAVAELKRCAGSQFEPAVVEAFLAVKPLIQPMHERVGEL